MWLIQKLKSLPLIASTWHTFRLRKIIKQHKRVAAICDKEIDAYLKGEAYKHSYTQKKNLGTEKIIWQYWESNGKEIPELVQICLRSVEKNAGDYLVIRLSDSNWHDYIDLPPFMDACANDKSHWTDALRLSLLTTYGGIWLDATVLLSGPILADYASLPLFLFQRDDANTHKEYWEHSWAY